MGYFKFIKFIYVVAIFNVKRWSLKNLLGKSIILVNIFYVKRIDYKEKF